MKAAVSVFLWFLPIACAAQAHPAQPAVPIGPPPISSSMGTYYPLPDEVRSKIREVQFQQSQLRFANESLILQIEQNLDRHRDLEMIAEIEQNLERERDCVDEIKKAAGGYALANHIDLSLFELDATQLKLIPKKKTQ